MTLILASSSAIRRHLLEAAGVAFEARRPEVDESVVKNGFTGDDATLAGLLAEAKAVDVSKGAQVADWVIGSDSLVSVEGRRYSKPRDKKDAKEHLREFRGKVMKLTSAVALARAGEVQWSHADTARLYVRDFSDDFVEEYLEAEWPEVGYTVGVFRLEARGPQLFDAIEGDHFTILGLPLIHLLGALRSYGLLTA